MLLLVVCACTGVGSDLAPPTPDPAKTVPFDPAAMTPPEYISGPEVTFPDYEDVPVVPRTALVKCVITADGSVTDCRVLRSVPGFDRHLIRLLEERHYEPAKLRGEPVAVEYTFKVTVRKDRRRF